MDTPLRTRAEHLVWAKQRALEYVEAGDLTNAAASMLSDLGKHPQFNAQIIGHVFAIEAVTGGLDTPEGMRRFIDGVN